MYQHVLCFIILWCTCTWTWRRDESQVAKDVLIGEKKLLEHKQFMHWINTTIFNTTLITLNPKRWLLLFMVRMFSHNYANYRMELAIDTLRYKFYMNKFKLLSFILVSVITKEFNSPELVTDTFMSFSYIPEKIKKKLTCI